MSEPIGFVGLGRMGAAIAGRMQAAGHPLIVWNRSDSPSVSALTSGGARRAPEVGAALAAPLSFSMLADDAAADAVLAAEALGEAVPGRVHVNLASVSTAMTDTLADRFARAGVAYVAAPVLGRPEVAAAGRLNVLVAGDTAALDRADPALAACSVRRWRLGAAPRQAAATKIALNFMLLHAIESMGEGIALVEAEGIAATEFVELFTQTLFGGMVHHNYGAIIAERRYTPPGFSMTLGRKDLELAATLARESGVDLASAPVLRSRLDAALADAALAEGDWAGIAEISRASARTHP